MLDREALETLLNAGHARAVAPFEVPTGTAVVTPEGYDVKVIADPAKPPAFIKQSVKLADVESFAAYLTRFGTDKSLLFADPENRVVKAIVDYHESEARHCSHVATFAPQYSEGWSEWFARHNKPQAQNDFADFLEERIADVLTPTGADLMEVAIGLRATKSVEFQSGTNLANGAVQFTYEETVKAQTRKANLEVPSRFSIGVPIFERSPNVSVVGGWLRYRITEGKLTFTVKLESPATAIKLAFDGLLSDIRSKVKQTIVIGST